MSLSLVSRQSRYSVPLLHPLVTLFRTPLEVSIAERILSFLGAEHQILSQLNKEWYETIKGKPFLLKVKKIQGETGAHYWIRYQLTRQDAANIFNQTQFEIPFNPGQQEREYHIGKGAQGTLYIGIDEKIYGPEHPQVLIRLNNLGHTLRELGKAKEAINLINKALNIAKKVYSSKHFYTAGCLNNLGLALRDLGETNKAIELFNQALEISGLEHPSSAIYLCNLANSLRKQGKVNEAIDALNQALKIFKKNYGDKHKWIAKTFNELGECYRKLNELDQSLDYLNRALEIDQELFDENHPNLARDLHSLAKVYFIQGNLKKALECIERAYKIMQLKRAEHPKTEKMRKLMEKIQVALAL